MVKIYDEYVENCVKNSKYPPYKAIGMAYIGFARDYPEFFKQMFMDENGNKIISSDNATFMSAIESVCKIFGCDKQTAMRFHLEMWVSCTDLPLWLPQNISNGTKKASAIW